MVEALHKDESQGNNFNSLQETTMDSKKVLNYENDNNWYNNMDNSSDESDFMGLPEYDVHEQQRDMQMMLESWWIYQ